MAKRRDLRRHARERLGLERLRPAQREAVEAVLEGRDTLAVMPTGSGKSAIYQLAGSLLRGPTIVVSPLIALQRDQEEAIGDQDTGTAARLNSLQGEATRADVLADLAADDLEFVLLAPEQLETSEVLEALDGTAPSLFVVDEAHCVSQWGHEFRPAYLGLAPVIERLSHPTVLALTATAAPPVREEIVERLGMRHPRVVVRGFDRPNLHLSAARFDDASRKRAALVDRVLDAEPPGIVYAGTRRVTEELAEALADRGAAAAPYHAGMRRAARDAVHAAFMEDRLAVVVATTAFGMGVDKPNVRFVFHHDIPESVDAYCQEMAAPDATTSRPRRSCSTGRRTWGSAASCHPAGPAPRTWTRSFGSSGAGPGGSHARPSGAKPGSHGPGSPRFWPRWKRSAPRGGRRRAASGRRSPAGPGPRWWPRPRITWNAEPASNAPAWR